MHVMIEGLVKTFTALSSGLTCSFWLILCWYHPRMYVMAKGLGKTFTALSIFFHSQQIAEKYIMPYLKLARWVIILSLSDVYVRSFFCHYHFNKISTTQNWVTETIFGPGLKSSPLETTNLVEHHKFSSINPQMAFVFILYDFFG